MSTILYPADEIVRYFIVLLRMSGIFMFAPFFSSFSIPIQVRVVFAMIASFVLAPALPLEKVPAELNLGNIAAIVTIELMFGVIIGFAALCVFAGMQFAGQIISFQLGFSLINLIDPGSDVQAPVFSFIKNYIGLLFFLLVNGHHWFLLAVNESFRVLPVGGLRIHSSLAEQMVDLSASILIIGLRIAGPILAITIITDVIIGVIGRTAPQLNLLVIGMPLKLLVGFGCMSFSLYFLPGYLESLFLSLSRTLVSLVHAMA